MNAALTALKDAWFGTFAFYYQAHAAHWNVTGPNFPQYHALFGAIYEDVHEAVDGLAERIRICGDFLPTDLSLVYAPSMPGLGGYLAALSEGNSEVIRLLYVAHEEAVKAATADDAYWLGIANYLQGRLDAHGIWAYKLRSTLAEE